MAVRYHQRIFSLRTPALDGTSWFVRTREGALGPFASLEIAEQVLAEFMIMVKPSETSDDEAEDERRLYPGELPICYATGCWKMGLALSCALRESVRGCPIPEMPEVPVSEAN